MYCTHFTFPVWLQLKNTAQFTDNFIINIHWSLFGIIDQRVCGISWRFINMFMELVWMQYFIMLKLIKIRYHYYNWVWTPFLLLVEFNNVLWWWSAFDCVISWPRSELETIIGSCIGICLCFLLVKI